jgi:hypothetical protein
MYREMNDTRLASIDRRIRSPIAADHHIDQSDVRKICGEEKQYLARDGPFAPVEVTFAAELCSQLDNSSSRFGPQAKLRLWTKDRVPASGIAKTHPDKLSHRERKKCAEDVHKTRAAREQSNTCSMLERGIVAAPQDVLPDVCALPARFLRTDQCRKQAHRKDRRNRICHGARSSSIYAGGEGSGERPCQFRNSDKRGW